MLPPPLLIADELGLGVDTVGEDDGMTPLPPVSESLDEGVTDGAPVAVKQKSRKLCGSAF